MMTLTSDPYFSTLKTDRRERTTKKEQLSYESQERRASMKSLIVCSILLVVIGTGACQNSPTGSSQVGAKALT